jgi:uncharacterized LabA/DUF88 family protein
MKTIVYVDGFNLYYGAVRNTPYKWLNLQTLCHLLLPHHNIVRIKYFIAKVSARPGDPGQPVRQQTFLRALKTIPNLEIVYGQFLQSKVSMPLANPRPGAPKFVTVIKTEEKGSDVNIASHMIHDGHLGLYDTAVIVSNDSDLVEPVKIVRYGLNKDVGMLNPHNRPSYSLKKHVTFIKKIRKGVLKQSQFPTQLADESGPFHKPSGW